MPPSWRPAPGYDAKIEQARGSFRDAMGGLKNLDQLLRSLKVGPKALATVIPDVRAGCLTMRQSVVTLLDAVESRLSGDHDAVKRLRAFVMPTVDAVATVLDIEGPVNARARLTLETSVRSHLDDLESARSLTDLLISSLWGISVRLELSDVVHQAFQLADQGDIAEGPELKATVAPPSGPIELLVNASAVVALLSIAVSVVAVSSESNVPHIQIHNDPGNNRGLIVTAEPGTGNQLTLTRQRLIDPTIPCIEEAAEAVGASLIRDVEDGRLSLLWRDAH